MERGDLLVSVIIPAYNAEIFLREAIGSVLGQAYRPIEVNVVDDGSTDGTAQIAAGYGDAVKCIRQPNAGPAAARNRGIAAAQGDVLAFLDADDVWTEGALEAQMSCLASNPSARIALGLTQLLRLTDTKGVPRFEPFGEPWHLLSLGAAVVRRAVFQRAGHFDESTRSAEDIDWFLRAREAGVTLARHERVVQHYRLHGGNMTRQKAWRDAHLTAAFKKSLDRRRQQGGDAAYLSPWFAGNGQEPETP
jgi:glycosyltransferase involved in cell wall biosynthesis